MEQTPQPEPLTTDELKLARGAEPFWMQDVRIAQRAIERARLAGRAAQSDSSSEVIDGNVGEGSPNPLPSEESGE